MTRPNAKLVRKRVGYHILAFTLGALAPLPFIMTADRTPETGRWNRPGPDSERSLERDAGVVRYVENGVSPPSNDQDDDRYCCHNA